MFHLGIPKNYLRYTISHCRSTWWETLLLWTKCVPPPQSHMLKF